MSEGQEMEWDPKKKKKRKDRNEEGKASTREGWSGRIAALVLVGINKEKKVGGVIGFGRLASDRAVT